MKKNLFYPMLCLVGIALASCAGNKDKNDGRNDLSEINRDIKFESYSFDMIGQYTGSDTIPMEGSRYIRFIAQGVLPQDVGANNVTLLRDTLMKLARISFNESNFAEPLLSDSVQLVNIQPSEANACGEVVSNLSTTLMTPRAIVWQNKLYSYPCGAAHGYTATTYINYSMNDGKILEYEDLMKPGFEEKLALMIREKIKEEDIQLLIPLSEVPVPVEFELTPQGMIFSYDPYQIAPFSEGTVQVELSAYELDDLLSKEGKYILLGVNE